MELVNLPGYVVVVHCDGENNTCSSKVYYAKQGSYHKSIFICDPHNIQNVLYELPDYEDRFDVYYHMSDDGNEYYDTMHIISEHSSLMDAEAAFVELELPSRIELLDKVKNILDSMLDKVIKNEVYITDHKFAINFLTNPAFLYSAYLEEGDWGKAANKRYNEIF